MGILHRDVKLENILVVKPVHQPSSYVISAMRHGCTTGTTASLGRLAIAPEVSGEGGRLPEWTAAADTWSTGAVMYCMLANSQLAWGREGPDFSSRPMRQLSDTAKQLLKELLAVRREERCSLTHAIHVSEVLFRSPVGLRRALGSTKSYSLLDLTSYGERNGVPRSAAQIVGTPAVSTSSSQVSLQRARCLRTTAALSITATRERARSVVSTRSCVTTRRSPPSFRSSRAPRRRRSESIKYLGGVALARATYRLTAWLRACGRSNSTTAVRRTCGVLSRSWRWLRTSTAATKSGSGGGGGPATSAGTTTGMSSFSLLLEGGASPLFGCLGGRLVERVRFSLPPSQCASLLNTLRAALAAGSQATFSPPVVPASAAPAAVMSASANALAAAAFPRSPSIAAQTPPSIPITPTSSQVLALGSRSPASARLKAKHGSPGGSPLSNRRSEAILARRSASMGGSSSPTSEGDVSPELLVQHEGALALLETYSAGGVAHDMPVRGIQQDTMRRGLSSGSLESLEHGSQQASASSTILSPQEEQLRRMRERFNAMRSASSGAFST